MPPLSLSALRGVGKNSHVLKAECSRSPSSSSSSPLLHRAASSNIPRVWTSTSKSHERSSVVNSTRFEDISQCFADECGITKQKEVEVVVDILTNPASGYIDRKLASKYRSFQLEELDSELHIKPVASYLQGLGATREQIRRMILTYPAVLGHSVDEHLRPLVEYLTDVGVKDAVTVLTSRPSLLGLRADKNLLKIVEWLEYEGYSSEQIVEYLTKSV